MFNIHTITNGLLAKDAVASQTGIDFLVGE
jgi:hypothetical protein